ncbi:MAG: ATP-dependent Clp protease proteolytic subunit [Paludibacteraceae bacterium]|jgi:ATP-dependent Clp protease protease subunit|nr:ATP-dependent Clp protease proteolytic subunit [Paludibacteraceae bacterium]
MNELENVLLSIPDSVATLQLPDVSLRDHYQNEQDRVYILDTAIDDSTLELVKYIVRCNKEDAGKPTEERKRILIMIDSPGGSVEVLASLIGAIKISKTPVWTCCYCTAYSAAADLLACGHKRFAFPMTSMMFHAGSAYYQGSQNEINSAKKFFDSMGKRVTDEVNSRTKFDNKFLKKLKTDDMYMNEEDALQYAVIDEIVTDLDNIY